MLEFELYQDHLAVYYRGRKIPVLPLYTTPTLHHVQYVAAYVARRLLEAGVLRFKTGDPRAAKVIELACRGRCTYGEDGVDVEGVLEEAYYNHLADRVLAYAVSTDALVIPCADQPLARALARRAREYAPGLMLVASQHGGVCPEADVAHVPQPAEAPIPLGPASRAALGTAMWAIDEGVAESPLTPLLDAEVP
ncbi:hypothetical protein [Pyrobaculum neutrophilum]|uniref:Uncharacterized protein n=1 Tax=Pyrobaculum neutrophilum (strain DSM 2338 / JCM 9278 / NBRC 100436 / V24Sta) TaxID=444157 RepID=B1Y8W7_PYRNV|nr:hypothetical protein [Pyrobaculum neutrophilum]ACB40196.1 conserved hypothetical protein [Pyrobaculum neutrophilum V24Sta]